MKRDVGRDFNWLLRAHACGQRRRSRLLDSERADFLIEGEQRWPESSRWDSIQAGRSLPSARMQLG
jgi:hypothetical protein